MWWDFQLVCDWLYKRNLPKIVIPPLFERLVDGFKAIIFYFLIWKSVSADRGQVLYLKVAKENISFVANLVLFMVTSFFGNFLISKKKMELGCFIAQFCMILLFAKFRDFSNRENLIMEITSVIISIFTFVNFLFRFWYMTIPEDKKLVARYATVTIDKSKILLLFLVILISIISPSYYGPNDSFSKSRNNYLYICDTCRNIQSNDFIIFGLMGISFFVILTKNRISSFLLRKYHQINESRN